MRASLILAAALLGSIAVPPLAAQDMPAADGAQTISEAEALAIDASLYAAAYGVAQEEALRRLSVMLDPEGRVGATADEQGGALAGSFFDNAATFAVVIRTTGAARADATITRRAIARFAGGLRDAAARAERRLSRRALRARFKLTDAAVEKAEDVLGNDVTVPLRFRGDAPRSLRELTAALASGFARLSRITGFQTAFIDERTGEAVVMVDGSADAATSQVAKVLAIPFRVEALPGGFKPVANIYGGSIVAIGGNRHCMSAFAARRSSDSKTGVVTAGHCATSSQLEMRDSSNVTVALAQGPTRNDSTMDLMFLSGAATGVGEFYYDNSGYRRAVTGTRSRASTNVSNGTTTSPGTTTGSFVCHLGQDYLGSTYNVQSCGEVISTTGNNSTGSTSGGNYVILRNTQSGAGTVRTSGTGTLKCYQGDSGGPWFAGNVAFGVTSACAWVNGTLNGTVSYSIYTSVDYFPTLGVAIVQ